MPTLAFCTLGCKVNQYDSQAMLELLAAAGYTPVPFSDVADVYVVNTCTVTGVGDKKSRQMIRRANRRNPAAAIVVTGCMAQRAARSLLLPGVRLVLGTQRRGQIAAWLCEALREDTPLIAVAPLRAGIPFEALRVDGSEGRTRATVKIQEGCENRCTYCVIPSVRGPIRSRPLADIAAEARRLASAGFAELVVTGIHLSSYGRDLGDATLADALRVLEDTPGIRRVRLGSLEPGIVTEAFVDALSGLSKLCPQFMLALQSGSDTVLRRMGRRYDTAAYARAAGLLRAAFPSMALTTDVMCGFPGETDAEFADTQRFLREMAFARVHVFPYSPREGTPAAAMAGQVPGPVKEQRAAALAALGQTLADAYAGAWIGQPCEALLEAADGEGYATGYSREYLRVRTRGVPGEIVRVLPASMTPGAEPTLHGARLDP